MLNARSVVREDSICLAGIDLLRRSMAIRLNFGNKFSFLGYTQTHTHAPIDTPSF